MSESTIFDVIVVGCGPAGIAALTRCHQAGLKVLGLEGGNRIGGRINTITLPGGQVELGAEFCHGQKDNIVYELSKDLNVLIEDKQWLPKVILSNGQVVNEEHANQLFGLWTTISDALSDKDDIPLDTNAGQFFEQEYQERIKDKQYAPINEALKRNWLGWMQGAENSLNASDTWYEVSARSYYDGYHDCEGNQNITWKHGYKTILDILFKRFPNPNEELKIDIKRNKEVSKIDYTNANGSIDKPVILTCRDGSIFKARSVIVTVSLGVLKEKHISLFQPSLPSQKIFAINSIGFGSLTKLVLHFENTWWSSNPDENVPAICVVWTDEDKAKMKDDDKWTLGINSISVASNKNVLIVWVAGIAAKETEALPDDVIEEKTMSVIKKILGNGKEIPNPDIFTRSKWYTNPLFRGAYSHRTLAAEKNNVSASDIEAPLTNEGRAVVCFAGEVTNPHHYSTVHGAIETGFREADRLIKQMAPSAHN